MHDKPRTVVPAATDAPPPIDGDPSRRYLALLSDIATRLLATDSSDTMVEDLFALIRAELRLDIFFHYRLDGGRLVLEAHGGLTPEQAAAGATLEIGQAVCGCVARDRVPAHATAVQASDDPLVAFVKDVGLDAYACTPLLHGGELIGTLGFGRRWADRFTPDELNLLRTVCHYVGFAKHRRHTEAQLRESVARRDRLLSELNHRVRNALQLAISLLQIDAGDAGDPAARAALERAAERIHILATAHRPLYASDESTGLDLQVLLQQVAEQAAEAGAIVASSAIVTAPIEYAVSLALLLHETLTTRRTDAPIRLRLTTRAGADAREMLVIDMAGLAPLTTPSPPTRVTQALARQLRATFTSAGESDLLLELPCPRHD